MVSGNSVQPLIHIDIIVTQARKLKKLKIVSYDWLEDSLMKRSPRKEGEYLMHRKIKAIAKAKAKKKVVRKENLKAGGLLVNPTTMHLG